MNANEFERAKIFSFSESIDYSAGGIVSKTVIKSRQETSRCFHLTKVKR